MSASPRGHLSESQLEGIRLFSELSSGIRLPSVRQVKSRRKDILEYAGANTQLHTSAYGNMYAKNSWTTLLKHVSKFCLILDLTHCFSGIRKSYYPALDAHVCGGPAWEVS
jgi:hypothetical protein